MIHELRTYEIFEHNCEAFVVRFREHAARIMRTYGFDIRHMWLSRHEGRLEFLYLLAWPDAAAKEAAWAAFMADQEWKAIKQKTAAEHGDLVAATKGQVLEPV